MLKLILCALFGAGVLVFLVGAFYVWPLWPTILWGFGLITPLITVASIQAAHPTETDHS